MKNQVQIVFKKLKSRKQTVSFAESCTGGLVSSLLTEIPGASTIFNGAVVGYANEAKRDLLGVSDKLLKKVGAVSEEVALAMAHGARKKLKTTWALSITGIAGPKGGTREKPVGLVYYALVGPNVEVVAESRFKKGSRNKIQRSAAQVAYSLLVHVLE